MAQHTLGWRRSVLAVALTILTVLVAAAVGWAVTVAASDDEKSSPASGGPDARPLSLQAAKVVYDNAMRSRDDRNVALFTSSTCQGFIDSEMRLRQVASVEDLLNAYAEATKLLPVQAIDNATVTAASSEGEAAQGSVTVLASITDNRVVPPSTERRPVTYAMRFEQGVWKLCPRAGPV